jgi:maltooligosyltrehalose trehalohydrolase
MTALLLLGPWTPLLFQGQEFGATTSFCYFSDVGDDKLKEAVRKGRFEFLAQFPSTACEEMQARIGVPHDPQTFEKSKLDWSERQRHEALGYLHRDLLRLRREDSRLSRQIAGRTDGAVLGAESFLLRFLSDQNDDRLLIVNLGRGQHLVPAPEPLLAPPFDFEWELLWSSESARYDGSGTVDITTEEEWILPAEAAFVLRPQSRTKSRKRPKKR